jgi:hypothetical protein
MNEKFKETTVATEPGEISRLAQRACYCIHRSTPMGSRSGLPVGSAAPWWDSKRSGDGARQFKTGSRALFAGSDRVLHGSEDRRGCAWSVCPTTKGKAVGTRRGLLRFESSRIVFHPQQQKITTSSRPSRPLLDRARSTKPRVVRRRKRSTAPRNLRLLKTTLTEPTRLTGPPKLTRATFTGCSTTPTVCR